MSRSLSLAHTLGAGQPNLPIQIHGENTISSSATRKTSRWTTFAPPAAGSSRYYLSRLSHRRSHGGKMSTNPAKRL
jgi:hypothetical protein